MRTETRTAVDERLTSDEVDALRLRLGQDDVRAHGAMTVADLAEALDLPPERVQVQLDRWREELAISTLKVKPRSQVRLLVLALALFASAYGIYEFSIQGAGLMTAEADLLASNARRMFRPKHIAYPVRTVLDLGTDSPPFGFAITIVGPATVTVANPRNGSVPENVEMAAPQLEMALTKALTAAIEIERKTPAPPPNKANVRFPGSTVEPGTFSYTIANSGSTFNVNELSKQGPGFIATTAKSAAHSIVEGLWRSEVDSLKPQPPLPEPAMMQPPMGFDVKISGRRFYAYGGQPLVVTPVDPAAVSTRLAQAIREYLRGDLGPQPYLPPSQRAADLKIPPPPFTEVSVHGPSGSFTFKVPTAPSPEYPTAAEVARAQEYAVVQASGQAADQVREINMRGSRK